MVYQADPACNVLTTAYGHWYSACQEPWRSWPLTAQDLALWLKLQSSHAMDTAWMMGCYTAQLAIVVWPEALWLIGYPRYPSLLSCDTPATTSSGRLYADLLNSTYSTYDKKMYMFTPLLQTWAILAIAVAVGGYLLFRATMPTPIPNIPYMRAHTDLLETSRIF